LETFADVTVRPHPGHGASTGKFSSADCNKFSLQL